MSTSNRRAKRVLERSAPHVGADVIVVAPGIGGHGFLATSMPTQSLQDLDALGSVLREASKKVERWRRRAAREAVAS